MNNKSQRKKRKRKEKKRTEHEGRVDVSQIMADPLVRFISCEKCGRPVNDNREKFCPDCYSKLPEIVI